MVKEEYHHHLEVDGELLPCDDLDLHHRYFTRAETLEGHEATVTDLRGGATC